jgi:hypothetical protein
MLQMEIKISRNGNVHLTLESKIQSSVTYPKFWKSPTSPERDVVICYWGCIISFRDAYPSHPHPYLFAGNAASLTGDVGDLQNVGYVTLLLL